MNVDAYWAAVRRFFSKAFCSSLHFTMATVTPDGQPHVDPIGSLILGEKGRAIYFERCLHTSSRNMENNQKVCVLAVRTGLLFWTCAFLRGRFSSPPAIRLQGTAGPRRAATDAELALWRRRARGLSATRGYRAVWRDMTTVREITFNSAHGLDLGEMTQLRPR